MLFYEVYLFSLLLYKQLPSKVKLLSLFLNVYFIGLRLFSEGKLYSSTSLIFPNIAFHIEVTPLVATRSSRSQTGIFLKLKLTILK